MAAVIGLTALTAGLSSSALAAVTDERVIAMTTSPYDVVVTPDSSVAWTSHSLSNFLIGITTGPNPHTQGVWNVPSASNTQLAISPGGTQAMVVDHGAMKISVVDLTSGSVETPLAFAVADPVTVAYSHDGQYAVAGFSGNNQVTLVRTSDWSVVHTWSMPAGVSTVIFTKDDSEVLAVIQDQSRIYRLDVSDPAQTSWFGTGSDPWGAALSPDGTRLYVALETGQGMYVHNVADGALLDSISIGMLAHDVAISPDGTQAWLTSPLNNKVSIVSLAPLEVQDNRDVDGMPFAVDFAPNGCEVWVTQPAANSDTVFDLDPCLAPPSPNLPDTGASQGQNIVLASVGGGLLILGAIALILVRRRGAAA